MKISTGTPPVEGRYAAFVRCRGRQVSAWCEPIIATWAGGKWHCGQMVYGWIGPLPAVKSIDLIEVPQEYDL
jgi:hypothetical protein